jgi:FlaA1/EpsC-like NDP-sugar epimerase
MRAEENMLTWDKLKKLLDELNNVNDSFDHVNLRKLLMKIVPGFKPQNEISDILYINKN